MRRVVRDQGGSVVHGDLRGDAQRVVQAGDPGDDVEHGEAVEQAVDGGRSVDDGDGVVVRGEGLQLRAPRPVIELVDEAMSRWKGPWSASGSKVSTATRHMPRSAASATRDGWMMLPASGTGRPSRECAGSICRSERGDKDEGGDKERVVHAVCVFSHATSWIHAFTPRPMDIHNVDCAFFARHVCLDV